MSPPARPSASGSPVYLCVRCRARSVPHCGVHGHRGWCCSCPRRGLNRWSSASEVVSQRTEPPQPLAYIDFALIQTTNYKLLFSIWGVAGLLWSVTLSPADPWLKTNCGVWCLSCAMIQSWGKTPDFSLNDTIILMLNTYLMHPLLGGGMKRKYKFIYMLATTKTLTMRALGWSFEMKPLFFAAKAEVFALEFRPGRVPDTKEFRTHSCSLLRPEKSLKNF